MTVIAYRGGVLAGDGRVCEHQTIITDTDQKVFKIGDYLFGYAGPTADGEKLKRSLIKNYDPGVLKKTDGIRVSKPGKKYVIELYENGVWWVLGEEYAAIGSGSADANVAMDFGATAVEACRAAIKRNAACGGKIRTVTLV